MPKKTILLTRPRTASLRWAALLARHGFDSAIEPLMTISPARAARPTGDFQAVLITSSNAADALEQNKAEIADLLSLPCFCVGAVSGEAAQALGFADIRCGDADGAELAQIVAATLRDKNRPLLHISGDAVDGKMSGILAANGFTLTPWIVYRALAVEDFTPATRDRFAAGDFDAVAVFSPRSARILVSIIEKNHLARACAKIAAVGLSQAVADVLQTLPWRHLRVAATPAADAVLACLHAEFSMTQPDAAPVSATMPQPRRGKKNCFSWLLLGFILSAGAGAAAIAHCPWLYPPPAPDSAALERRIDNLETRLNALAEKPVAPEAATDDAGLAATVKDLEAQVAQLAGKNDGGQQAAQKSIAAAFAFWDLREAATQGRNFAAQLAALRAAAGDDAASAEQLAKLGPYADEATPTLAQLRAALASEEMSLPAAAPDGGESLGGRVKAILRPLISVRPLHDPRFAALEQKLDSGDAQAALETFKALPDEAQKKLAAWREKLEARAAIDDAVAKIAARIAAPPAPEKAP